MLVLNNEQRDLRCVQLREQVAALKDSTVDAETFFDLVFGPRGAVLTAFPHKEERVWLVTQPLYKQFEQMYLDKVRSGRSPEIHVTRTITVRLPRCDHVRLKFEAEAAGLSLNEFCVRRLAMVPPATEAAK
jgi:predicted HicB family RNase H-like nuclease